MKLIQNIFKKIGSSIEPIIAGDGLNATPIGQTTSAAGKFTNIDAPIGRCATFVVAANDSSTLSKQQADYYCDGTDDNVQIQAAIDALPAGGGKVVLLEGTFTLSSALTIISSNVAIVGAGISTVLDINNATNNGIVIGNGSTWYFDITIRDLRITNSVAMTGGTGIITEKVKMIRLQNLRFDTLWRGISLSGQGTTFWIESCDFLDFVTTPASGIGISINGDGSNLNEIYIRDCILSNNLGSESESALVIKSASGIYLFNISIFAHKYGILVNPDTAGDYVEWLWIKKCLADTCINSGITLAPSPGYEVRGIYIEDSWTATNSGNAGLELSNSGNLNNVWIVNHKSLNNKYHGIAVWNGEYIYIDGCDIGGNSKGTANTSNGIDVAAGISNWSINNSVISSSRYSAMGVQKYGINIGVGSSNYYYIENNDLRGNGTDAIYDAGTGTSKKIYQQFSDLLMDVLAVSTTYVRSNEDLSAGTPITFTIDAQPDVPRTLSWSFDTHAQITEYDMEVIGIDTKGNSVTETWDETAGWSGETNNAFATITSIKMTSRTGTGAADTMDIGITDVLGLSNVIYSTSDVFKIKKNNANATVATAQVNTTYDTYDMSVITLGAGDDFTIWYKSNLNIIS